MKPEEKKLILVLVIITVIVGVVAYFIMRGNNKTNNNNNATIQENVADEYVQTLDDGSRLNVSEELQKTKTLDGLEITNIQLKEIGGVTTLLADVENKTDSKSSEKKIKVKILDKSGNVITVLKGIIDPMNAGEKVQLNIAVSADVANAYNFSVENQ